MIFVPGTMENNDKTFASHIFTMIVEEKEAYQGYCKLCQRYEVDPDQVVQKISINRLNLLYQLYKMAGEI